jgi:maltose O-acetyltransferase
MALAKRGIRRTIRRASEDVIGMPNEREKMVSGELYRASDPELVELHLRAQDVLERYNATTARDNLVREALLKELLGSVGENCAIKPPFSCDYGVNIRVGRNLFVNYGCVFLDCATITIGDDVQIGPSVQIYTATHPLNPAVRRAGLEAAKPVSIGDNVWIGGAAIILAGVNIGNDAVVGAGSVVTRDVAAGAVVVGNPARTRP